MASRTESKRQRKLDKEVQKFEFSADPDILRLVGPIIETDITITDSHKDLLEAAGKAIPVPVRCRLLLDTGAFECHVRHEIAEKAGLKLINSSAPSHGIGVDLTGRKYIGRVLFVIESKVIPGTMHNIWIDTPISSITGENLKRANIDGLIGRDVLRYFRFVYDGNKGEVSLRYYRRHEQTK